jgi:putative ABC transport system permease protein
MSLVRNGNLKLALESVRSTRFRSFLTMLGIILGVMSVILIIGVGEGVKRQITQQTIKYGDNVLVVRPMAEHRGPLGGDSVPIGSSGLLNSADVAALQRVPGVIGIVPLSSINGSIYGDHKIETPLIIATTPEFAAFIKPQLKSGGFFDNTEGAEQVVLGLGVADKLYDDTLPLGRSLKLRGKDFLVSGIFKNFNAPPLSIEANFNNAVFVPLSTVKNITGSEPAIYEMLVRAHAGTDMKKFQSAITTTLSEAHGGSRDFVVTRAGQAGSGSDQTVRLLTLLTFIAAMIAFVVGGIGIMNMMFVTVTERIHEIGIRKAIGATNTQIMKQFVAEAFVLSCLGAIYGVICALAGLGLLRLYTSIHPVLVWQAIVLAPIVAVASGVFFGSIPALKAARKDPIQALRHE